MHDPHMEGPFPAPPPPATGEVTIVRHKTNRAERRRARAKSMEAARRSKRTARIKAARAARKAAA